MKAALYFASKPGPLTPGLRWRGPALGLAGALCAVAAWGQTAPNWGALSTAPAQRTEPVPVATPASAPVSKRVTPASALGA